MRPISAFAFLTLLLLLRLVEATPALADSKMVLEGNLTQGGLVFGTVTPGAEVRLAGRNVRVSPEGRFVIGFGRDAAEEIELMADYPNGAKETRLIPIKQRDYEIQRIDGVAGKYVSPPDDALERIKRENEAIARVRSLDRPEPLFESGFVWPAVGPISGVYGSQRILNGEPRQPHFGVDVAAPLGSPVTAPADGVVSLVETDLYYTGGTVILDHGHGLTSAFLHLQSVSVTLGQRLKQGEMIGTVGSTGRSTGPHLDWRINWFNERIDPELLVGPMPTREALSE